MGSKISTPDIDIPLIVPLPTLTVSHTFAEPLLPTQSIYNVHLSNGYFVYEVINTSFTSDGRRFFHVADPGSQNLRALPHVPITHINQPERQSASIMTGNTLAIMNTIASSDTACTLIDLKSTKTHIVFCGGRPFGHGASAAYCPEAFLPTSVSSEKKPPDSKSVANNTLSETRSRQPYHFNHFGFCCDFPATERSPRVSSFHSICLSTGDNVNFAAASSTKEFNLKQVPNGYVVNFPNLFRYIKQSSAEPSALVACYYTEGNKRKGSAIFNAELRGDHYCLEQKPILTLDSGSDVCTLRPSPGGEYALIKLHQEKSKIKTFVKLLHLNKQIWEEIFIDPKILSALKKSTNLKWLTTNELVATFTDDQEYIYTVSPSRVVCRAHLPMRLSLFGTQEIVYSATKSGGYILETSFAAESKATVQTVLYDVSNREVDAADTKASLTSQIEPIMHINGLVQLIVEYSFSHSPWLLNFSLFRQNLSIDDPSHAKNASTMQLTRSTSDDA